LKKQFSFFLIAILLTSVLTSNPFVFNNFLQSNAYAQTTNNEIRDIGNYVVFGLEEVVIKKDVTINSGSVGVNADSEIKIEKGTIFSDSNSALVGDDIEIKKDAVVQNVFFNELDNKGTILGTQNTPLELPVVENFPELPDSPPGTESVSVPKGESLTLPPGQFDEIFVDQDATLIFEGGSYSATSIEAKKEAKLLFDSSSEIVVQEEIKLDKEVTLGPSETSGISASDIVIFVGGNTVSEDDETKETVVDIDKDSVINANIFAPNGEIKLKKGTQATGSFIAQSVVIEKDSVMNHDPAFGIQALFNDLERIILELEKIGGIVDESIVTDNLEKTITDLKTDTENLVTDPTARDNLTSILDSALQSVSSSSLAVLALDENESNVQINSAKSSVDNYITEVQSLSGSTIPTNIADDLIADATTISENSLKRTVDATFLTAGIPLTTTTQIIDQIETDTIIMRSLIDSLEVEGFTMIADSRTESTPRGFVKFSNPTTGQETEFEIPNLALSVMSSFVIFEEAPGLGIPTTNELFAQFLAANPDAINIMIVSPFPVPSAIGYFDATLCLYGGSSLIVGLCIAGGITGSILIDVVINDVDLSEVYQEISTQVVATLQNFYSDAFPSAGGPDVVVGGESGLPLGILFNEDGRFSSISFPPVSLGTRDIAVADFNKDGFDDIVTANHLSRGVTVLLSNGFGDFHPPGFFSVVEPTTLSESRPVAVTVSDFNNDGKVDIATTNVVGNSVSVLLNTTPDLAITPSFASAKESQLILSFFIAPSPTDLDDADFNNDGIRDLVSTEQRGTIIINIGLGDGRFLSGSFNIFSIASPFVTTKPQAVIAAADFDGDGDTDIVAADINLDKVFLMVNEGPKDPSNNDILNFTRGGGTSVGGLNPVAIELLEGGAFIVTANFDSDDISVLRNTGSGFTLFGTFSVGAGGPFDLAVGDLNDDGIQDVVTANRNSNNISVLFGTGGGGFEPPIVFSTFTVNQPRAIAIGDFDPLS